MDCIYEAEPDKPVQMIGDDRREIKKEIKQMGTIQALTPKDITLLFVNCRVVRSHPIDSVHYDREVNNTITK